MPRLNIKQLELLKVRGENLAEQAQRILKNLTPKDTYLSRLNPEYLNNLRKIADTNKSTSLVAVRGTQQPSARMVAFLPESMKVGIHGYQGKSIFDPKHVNNFGQLSHFIADNKLNAARYFAQHEELIMPFLKSSEVPNHQKKMLIELFQDGILAPLKKKGLKQFEENKLLISRAEKNEKDPRIYDGTLKSLFKEDPKTHKILNWEPKEYQEFVDNVDLFSQHLPTEKIENYGGLREAIIPHKGVYSINIGQHYKDPLSGIQTLSYIGKPSSAPTHIKISNTKLDGLNPAKFEDLLEFQKSSAFNNTIKSNKDLQTLIYNNVFDPLEGYTIATRNPGIIWIKNGGTIKKKWKPKKKLINDSY